MADSASNSENTDNENVKSLETRNENTQNESDETESIENESDDNASTENGDDDDENIENEDIENGNSQNEKAIENGNSQNEDIENGNSQNEEIENKNIDNGSLKNENSKNESIGNKNNKLYTLVQGKQKKQTRQVSTSLLSKKRRRPKKALPSAAIKYGVICLYCNRRIKAHRVKHISRCALKNHDKNTNPSPTVKEQAEKPVAPKPKKKVKFVKRVKTPPAESKQIPSPMPEQILEMKRSPEATMPIQIPEIKQSPKVLSPKVETSKSVSQSPRAGKRVKPGPFKTHTCTPAPQCSPDYLIHACTYTHTCTPTPQCTTAPHVCTPAAPLVYTTTSAPAPISQTCIQSPQLAPAPISQIFIQPPQWPPAPLVQTFMPTPQGSSVPIAPVYILPNAPALMPAPQAPGPYPRQWLYPATLQSFPRMP